MNVRCPTEYYTAFWGRPTPKSDSDVLDPPLPSSFAYAPLGLLFLCRGGDDNQSAEVEPRNYNLIA